ncbi:VWA domain-containing protein [Vibrio sp. ZSDE26]|uniref:VWA domain-containing protein n=1 Tax=Vibrio amylolyticus TaxID=2847292 RepID=A0A9X1XIA8_9VIBR|nr:VWA domain-containing protein [Vibrio amylolyticus]MCK6263474.1 VWA domain-containing protein [Vibrio amylolyticus]
MIEFEYSWLFLLLPMPILIYYFAPRYQTREHAIKVPFFNQLVSSLNLNATRGAGDLKATTWQRFSLVSGWVLIIVAAAKPMWLGAEETRHLSGRDLMMLVDLSGSMATRDFTNIKGEQTTRLAASKEVLNAFSQQREGDRLGLIVFGEAAYVQSPFTLDHNAWLTLLNETEPSMAGPSTHLGDAIGLGIKTFLSEVSIQADLEGQQAAVKVRQQQRVMIVLTDGNDTDSLVPPIDAAKVAAEYNIRIHVVTMGNPNTAGEQAIDMGVIEKIASMTGGESFLAMSPTDLSEIYQAIHEIEPQVFESFTYRPKTSYHHLPVIIALLHQLVFMLFRTLNFPIRSFRKQLIAGKGVSIK